MAQPITLEHYCTCARPVEQSFELEADAHVTDDDRAARRAAQRSFFGQKKLSHLMGPGDMVPQDTDYAFLMQRLLVRIEIALAHFEQHGYGIHPEHVRSAESELTRKLARRSALTGEPGDETDPTVSIWDVNWNKLRANKTRCFKQLDLEYARKENLIEIENMALDVLQIGNVRDVLYSYGDGAPVSTMTNPDGTQHNASVLWIAGAWHA